MMAREIAVPFDIGPDGWIKSTSDPVQQFVGHLISLIGTNPPERQMRPTYGVHATDRVFDSNDALLRQHLKTDILRAAAAWEPGVEIVQINLTPSTVDVPTDSSLQLEVLFRLRGSVQNHLAEILVGGTVMERTETL